MRHQVLFLLFAFFKASQCSDLIQIPTTTLEELSTFVSDAEVDTQNFLRDVGGRIGVFAVSRLGEQFSSAMETYQELAPECLQNFDVQLPVANMADGSRRRTYATEDKVYPACLVKPMKTLAEAFDKVELKVAQLIKKMSGTHDIAFQSGNDVIPIEDAPIKDHLHVYSKKEFSDSNDKQYLVPFHVDNGLFLLLTPFPDPSLQVKLSNGEVVSTNGFGSDTILILMGRGLTDWLFQNEKTDFHAVPHAVPALSPSGFDHRAIFARMKVASMDAVPLSHKGANEKLKSFGSIFFETAPVKSSQKTQRHEGLCSDTSMPQTPIAAANFFQANILNCDNITNAYCWMACLPLPNGCTLEESECYNANHEPCNTVDDAPPHDATCSWHCETGEQEFCAGGMDMLMAGFETQAPAEVNLTKTCVILFFKSWKLNSASKFATACVGVFTLGLFIEVLITVRRQVVARTGIFSRMSQPLRKSIVIALFATNLVLGYLAMLVAMTYSVELFICVVVGIVLGHSIFNSHTPVGETVDPCCANQNQATPESGNPAGLTPCENGAAMLVDDHDSVCHCDTRSSARFKI